MKLVYFIKDLFYKVLKKIKTNRKQSAKHTKNKQTLIKENITEKTKLKLEEQDSDDFSESQTVELNETLETVEADADIELSETLETVEADADLELNEIQEITEADSDEIQSSISAEETKPKQREQNLDYLPENIISDFEMDSFYAEKILNNNLPESQIFQQTKEPPEEYFELIPLRPDEAKEENEERLQMTLFSNLKMNKSKISLV